MEDQSRHQQSAAAGGRARGVQRRVPRHPGRLIHFETLFRGTIDSASVYPREVVKRALAHNAAAVILVHNHPSGDPEPSDADRRITQRLKEALGLVEIRVIDHIVVGSEGCQSFAKLGCI